MQQRQLLVQCHLLQHQIGTFFRAKFCIHPRAIPLLREAQSRGAEDHREKEREKTLGSSFAVQHLSPSRGPVLGSHELAPILSGVFPFEMTEEQCTRNREVSRTGRLHVLQTASPIVSATLHLRVETGLYPSMHDKFSRCEEISL